MEKPVPSPETIANLWGNLIKPIQFQSIGQPEVVSALIIKPEISTAKKWAMTTLVRMLELESNALVGALARTKTKRNIKRPTKY